MKTKKINDEVLSVEDPILWMSRKDVHDLVYLAQKNPRKRIRICAHRQDSEKHQEMFIVHMKGAYVRPHRHTSRAESFTVLEGVVDVVMFDEKGNIANVIRMSDFASGFPFYYRIAEPVFHTLIIRSDYLLFKESTSGPFVREQTEFAPWAPADNQAAEVVAYNERLNEEIEPLLKETKK